MNKKQISVLCGGQSTEHEISILSARNVVKALDSNKYDVRVIYITRQGRWYLLDKKENFISDEPMRLIEQKRAQRLLLQPGEQGAPWALQAKPEVSILVDCVFPVLHGTLGEDGAPQGVLDMLNVPYVGSGVLGSAVCLAKHISKSLLRASDIPTVDWQLISFENQDAFSYVELAEQLGDILMVKPASLGSSVGISKVRDAMEFDKALEKAFLYENRVLVEQYIGGREIECSVLGNENPVASLPGEVVVAADHEFYSYEAKYLDPDAAKVITPANLPIETVQEIQNLSIRAYKVLECRGMARVDFFVTPEQEIYVNELNTIPGFTNISMYPKNWEASGVSYSELLDDLINLALAEDRRRQSFSKVRAESREVSGGEFSLES